MNRIYKSRHRSEICYITTTVFCIMILGLPMCITDPPTAAAAPTVSAETKPIVKVTVTPTPTATPTPTSTPTPTPTPSPTPTPTPLPEPFSGQWSFKSYESYKCITNKSSDQYALQQEAYTGDYGIRMVDGRYCVAMGSYWATEIGTKMDVYLETGEMIPVILGDTKQNAHTDSTHRYGSSNHDVLEFIVDMSEIPPEVENCGSYNVIFEGKVCAVEIVE